MSGFKGGKRFKRIIQQLPDVARQELVDAFGRAGRRAQAAMRARAKRKTGALSEGVKYKVLPKTLRLQVGLLGTKRGRAKLFYGFILDKGRAAQTVLVQRRKRVNGALRVARGRKIAADVVSTYQMKVRGFKGDRFVSGEYPDLRNSINREVKPLFDRVLSRMARGE